MKQGYSGSSVQRQGDLVKKVSNDQAFIESQTRQNDLMALSRKVAVLPRIARIDGPAIYMDYVDGREGLTEHNARQAGGALRLLHEQRDYPHPCMTGLKWLIELANENLARMDHSQRINAEIEAEYPSDALIHSEPAQFVERQDGSIVFIDFEGIGMGSCYQDLGHIYYSSIKEGKPEICAIFLEGYQSGPGPIELLRIKKLAGVISLAYVGFGEVYAGHAEAEERMRLGFRLLGEAEQE